MGCGLRRPSRRLYVSHLSIEYRALSDATARLDRDAGSRTALDGGHRRGGNSACVSRIRHGVRAALRRDAHAMNGPPIWKALFALGLLCGTGPAQADENCASPNHPGGNSTLNVRFDNDLFGGLGQDQGYSNGFLVTRVSPNLVDDVNDPCLPATTRWMGRRLSFLNLSDFDQLNVTAGVAQLMYTPNDPAPRNLIADDRPYAGVLMLSLGYSAAKDDRQQTSLLRFGILGPAAQAGKVQNAVHKITGGDRFNGWRNQLRNEPVVQLIHERRRRIFAGPALVDWRWDATAHWGGSLGNFATYANTGAEVRFGRRVPDDFGTAALGPAAENTTPAVMHDNTEWDGHLFLAFDARWVLRDITLDGNTFRSGHSVDKRAFVADVGYGIAIARGHWKIVLGRYHRTREFNGQRNLPAFGSLMVSKQF